MAEILLLWILFSLLVVWMIAFAVLALRRSDNAKLEQEAMAQSYKLSVPKVVHSKQASMGGIGRAAGDVETASA
jgi:hypothetical protein